MQCRRSTARRHVAMFKLQQHGRQGGPAVSKHSIPTRAVLLTANRLTQPSLRCKRSGVSHADTAPGKKPAAFPCRGSLTKDVASCKRFRGQSWLSNAKPSEAQVQSCRSRSRRSYYAGTNRGPRAAISAQITYNIIKRVDVSGHRWSINHQRAASPKRAHTKAGL